MEGGSGRTAYVDPVDAFLKRSGSREEAAILLSSLNPIIPEVVTVEVLRYLASTLAWGAVLETAGSLLHGRDELDEKTRLEAVTYRIGALIQSRQLDRAAEQISALGPDLRKYFVEGSDEAKSKELETGGEQVVIPFELKALSADVIARKGSAKAMEAFCELRGLASKEMKACEEQNDEQGYVVWRSRLQILLSSICAYHLRLQNTDAALDVSRELIQTNPESIVYKFVLVRLLILAGDFRSARKAIVKISDLPDVNSAEVHLHRGLLLAAESSFDEALDEFEANLLLDPSNIAAANNAAICLLHMGRLAEAVEKLEETLRSDPILSLDEGFVFNLCTLYDLSQPDRAKEQKTVLRKLAARFGRQGFNMEAITI